jgi:hypothetical protein
LERVVTGLVAMKERKLKIIEEDKAALECVHVPSHGVVETRTQSS